MGDHQNKTISSEWENIWAKFKKGDKEAFEIIYNEHIDFLYSYGTKITGNTDLVEDAIQDLFLYLLSRRNYITTPNLIRYYLLKAFKRILLEKIKKEKSFSSDDITEQFYFDISIEIDEAFEKKIKEKKLELIENLVEQLDSRKKEVIFLKFHSGLTYNEIGDIVGIQPSSVKKLIYRTIASFREILKDKTIELFFFFTKLSNYRN